ncbi:MAG: hypothetical protein WB766_03755 [Roseiarcus sp.]
MIATLLSIWLRISSALSEIVVGTIAQLKANSIACRDSQANVELRFVKPPAAPFGLDVSLHTGPTKGVTRLEGIVEAEQVAGERALASALAGV